MTERMALIAMNRVQGLGSITAKRIAEHLGSLANAFDCPVEELTNIPNVGLERARLITQELSLANAESELEQAQKHGVNLVTWVDEGYPAMLQQIADPPLVLYVAGSLESLKRTSVAIVGTRHPTVYGRETARRFGYQLGAAGFTVVSGLALGIDTESHIGCLKGGGQTVAILGGALDCLFPSENRKLAREMVEKGGAVISEYPFGRQPDRQTFPMRNRIVSGLCKGVLVVEAPIKSGTMITVSQALEQGRTIMAVPGRIDSPASQGSHKLLREGARLITCVDDIIEEVQDLFATTRQAVQTRSGSVGSDGPVGPHPPAHALGAPSSSSGPVPAAAAPPSLSPDERTLIGLIEREGTLMDTLIRSSGLDAGRVSALLTGLQIKRLVRLLPGGVFAPVQRDM